MSDVDLLKLLLKATQVGKVKWKQVRPQVFEATVGNMPYIIELQNPSLVDGSASYVSLFRVVVAGVLITFADGSEQGDIVEAILAIASRDWADHVLMMEKLRVEAANRLVAIIEEQ